MSESSLGKHQCANIGLFLLSEELPNCVVGWFEGSLRLMFRHSFCFHRVWFYRSHWISRHPWCKLTVVFVYRYCLCFYFWKFLRLRLILQPRCFQRIFLCYLYGTRLIVKRIDSMAFSQVWHAWNEIVLSWREPLSNTLFCYRRLKYKRSLGRCSFIGIYCLIFVEGRWHLVTFFFENEVVLQVATSRWAVINDFWLENDDFLWALLRITINRRRCNCFYRLKIISRLSVGFERWLSISFSFSHHALLKLLLIVNYREWLRSVSLWQTLVWNGYWSTFIWRRLVFHFNLLWHNLSGYIYIH